MRVACLHYQQRSSLESRAGQHPNKEGKKKKKKSKPSEGMKEKEKREDYVGPQTTSCNLNILNLK